MPLIATAALSYQWVFLKDADTARTDVDTTGLPGIDIPVSGTGSVDPLAAPLSKAPVTYTVRHSAELPAWISVKEQPRIACRCAAGCRALHTAFCLTPGSSGAPQVMQCQAHKAG